MYKQFWSRITWAIKPGLSVHIQYCIQISQKLTNKKGLYNVYIYNRNTDGNSFTSLSSIVWETNS